ncbi:MAG: polyprenyl diphosphate synthase [Cystobacterineae bacterium]|nr:polyprenyl diphosphate synthase [Cystobacterineae bacterium]
MKSLNSFEPFIKQRPLPRHIGIIMDGNGRWAELRGLPRLEGHREGANRVREVTRCARRLGLEAVTLYAFSMQNWMRPWDEIEGLMALLSEYLLKERHEILDNQIKLNVIGELDRLPDEVREPLLELCEASASNKEMVLTLAVSYGSREELVFAARRLAQRVARGEMRPEEIDAKALEGELFTFGLPEVDMLVRTSGELRISNFLLWQSAYAELVFSSTLWPDFREPQFLDCLAEYQRRERRFGYTSAQLRSPST